MRVTLIRHGEAADDAPRDEERALTRRGREGTRRVGRCLGRRRIGFDCMVASPLVRAVQTAEILAEAVGFRDAIRVERALLPAADPAAVLDLLRRLRCARVALVAHEPILSGVAGLLLGQRFRPLDKSEAVRIKLGEGGKLPGSARWRVDPETGKLRRLT